MKARTLEAVARAALAYGTGRVIKEATPDPPKPRRRRKTPAERQLEQLREQHRRDAMTAQARAVGLPDPLFEFKFHATRKWRLDIAWPDHRLAAEIEGGIWTGGRHTRGAGFRKDVEKYNALAAAGWRLVRGTPADARSGQLWRDAARAFHKGAP